MTYQRTKIFAFIFLLCMILAIQIISLYKREPTHLKTRTNFPEPKNIRSSRKLKYKSISNEMEAVIRITFSDKLMYRFHCDLLRSSAVYWNSKLLGNFLLIFDEKDKPNTTKFVNTLNKIPSLSFRVYHEEMPKSFEGSKIQFRLGYLIQLYSSFLMDLYTKKSILAWVDTDTVFTAPVIAENVMNSKGQLIVKGLNLFQRFSWVNKWDNATRVAIGLPMVADFMTYFPVFLFTSTIRNCRRFIMSRMKKRTFEEAFIEIALQYFPSPVSIILSYAYYFEHDLYEWHIDTDYMSLSSYNLNRLPYHPLEGKDILPELHVSVHSGYNQEKPHPLEIALCYTHISGQKPLSRHCLQYLTTGFNRQSFEFQDHPNVPQNHYKTWCKGRKLRNCAELTKRHYQQFWEECNHGLRRFTPSLSIQKVEAIARRTRKINCPKVNI